MSNNEFGEQYFWRRSQGSRFFRGKGLSFLKYPFWDRVIRRRVRGGKLLDIGCAEGFLLKWAEKRGYDSYGIDISEYAILELSRRRLSGSRLCLASVAALPFIDNYFDAITCFDVLEHLEQPPIGLKEINRCLKRGGMLVMSTPNIYSYGVTLKGDSWFGYQDTTHVSLLSTEEWENLLERTGFEATDEFYDTLWNPPYFKHIPAVVQRIVCSSLVLLQYWTGVRFPRRWGENLYIVARKKQNSREAGSRDNLKRKEYS